MHRVGLGSWREEKDKAEVKAHGLLDVPYLALGAKTDCVMTLN
jgi:hypothetical protein